MGTEKRFREHAYYPTTYLPRVNTVRRPSRTSAKPNALVECLKPGSNPPGRPRGEGHTHSVLESINVAPGFRLVSGFDFLLRPERERKPAYWQDFGRLFIMDDSLEDSIEDLLDDDLLGVPIGFQSLAALYLSLHGGELEDPHGDLQNLAGVSLEVFLDALGTDDFGDE